VNQLLSIGATLFVQPTNVRCTVEEFLGGGGQGEVYRVCMGAREKALKWYFAELATKEQYELLQTIIEMGPPGGKKEYLWPEALVTSRNKKGFGYIMPLREKRFKGIVDMMRGDVNPSFQVVCIVGRKLADCYLHLHTSGLCYRDINFNNVFFDPQNGDVRICDNDNVAVGGSGFSGVIGTPRFMAPEIVRGEAYPSADTDKYSLAVLLFYLFFVHHPLEGKAETQIHCLDQEAMKWLYGIRPVFIFDPENDTNRPVPGYHDNAIQYWNIYPTFLKHLFIRAFTEGLQPGRRVAESEWRRAMVRLFDSIVYCNHCARENFYDDETHRHASVPLRCWNCGRHVSLPPILRLQKPLRHVVALRHDIKLYPYHVRINPDYDFNKPVAAVSKHPQYPNVWGLQNRSETVWRVILPNGEQIIIEPGRSIRLQNNMTIDFGEVNGVLETA